MFITEQIPMIPCRGGKIYLDVYVLAWLCVCLRARMHAHGTDKPMNGMKINWPIRKS